MKILREFIQNGEKITEYTVDGLNVVFTQTVQNIEDNEIPVAPSPVEPQPTIEEKLARMERQLEEQALVQLEVLATIYEEIVMKG